MNKVRQLADRRYVLGLSEPLGPLIRQPFYHLSGLRHLRRSSATGLSCTYLDASCSTQWTKDLHRTRAASTPWVRPIWTPHTAVPASTPLIDDALARIRSATISAKKPPDKSVPCCFLSAATPAGYETIAYTRLIRAITSGTHANAMPTFCARNTRKASEKRASAMTAPMATIHQ